jgi:hypothetical protein
MSPAIPAVNRANANDPDPANAPEYAAPKRYFARFPQNNEPDRINRQRQEQAHARTMTHPPVWRKLNLNLNNAGRYRQPHYQCQ